MARAPRMLPNGRRPTSAEELADLRRRVAESAASRPGVYRMLSDDGGVIYVGKSRRVRERVLGYFRCGRREKGARILRETRAIEWDYTPSEFAALREELRLIKRLRPRFNVAGKRDATHYAFLHLTEGPAPKLALTRGDAGDVGFHYGPFIGPGLVAEAARELSDALGLRDCPDHVPMAFRDPAAPVALGRSPAPAPRAPDCLRHEVGKCLGPCISACSAAEYDERVALARAFLEGATDGPIDRLRSAMELSREALEYERAALFRDRLFRLERLREQFRKIRFAVEALSFVYPVRGFDGDDRVYLIRRGTLRAEVPAPRSTADRLELQRLIDRVFAPGEPARGAVRPHEIEEILLHTAWFRRHPDELARTWRPAIS